MCTSNLEGEDSSSSGEFTCRGMLKATGQSVMRTAVVPGSSDGEERELHFSHAVNCAFYLVLEHAIVVKVC